MTKIWAQKSACMWGNSGSIASGAILSGSFSTFGYSTLVGIVRTDVVTQEGSGVTVQQSVDSGTTWDHTSVTASLAASTSGSYNLTVLGNYARVLIAASDASAVIRSRWTLRPIQ